MAEEQIEANAAGAATGAVSRTALMAWLDSRLTRAALRGSPVGRDIRTFSQRFEECARAAGEGAGGEVRIAVEGADGSYTMAASDESAQRICEFLQHLPAFLGRLGVRSIVCDRELESNQVRDVLETLWQIRRGLRRGRRSWWDRVLGRPGVAGGILSDDGLHMSCAEVIYKPDSGELSVRNSYCQLVFSRAVTAYKRRRKRFRDHRAFFRAAPRFAVLVIAFMLLPELLHFLFAWPESVTVAITAAMAVLVGFCVYIVFQTIAAVEYDKEHQAKEIERSHQELVRTYGRLQRDLETARTIQRTFLPDASMRPFPGHLAFAESFVPEMAVGGDYYDLKIMDDRRVAVLLADVSGHGMSAAFITGLIKTSFELSYSPEDSPGEFLAMLNKLLVRLTPSSSFAAVVFAVYDVQSRVLLYANAGHGPVPVLLRPGAGGIDVLEEPVDLLAGVYPEITYEVGQRELTPGDKLMLCTDGVTDCVNAEGDRWTQERLHALLKSNVARSAAELKDRIMQALEEHAGGAEQNDDRAVLAMEVLK